MNIDEKKYRELFIKTFAADAAMYDSEYDRIIKEHGESDEMKLRFFEAVFNEVIQQFKKEIDKDQNFESYITYFYNCYINQLNSDGIDSTEQQSALKHFQTVEIPSYAISISEVSDKHKIENKQYNLNTKYGRKKAREQAQRNIANITPEEKSNHSFVSLIVLLIILIILFLILGPSGFLKWANR